MKSRMIRVVGVVAVLLLFAGAQLAQAQVLDQVPAETLVVIKVANLQSTSGKLAKLMHELGVDAMAPQMQDPLGAFQQKMKVNNGLDKGGEMAFVFIDPAASGGNPDKSMLVLLPVSDYKAFLSNFPDAQTEGAVSQVQFADAGEPGFVANWGKYAAISPTKEVVALKPAGLKAQGLSAKEVASKDIVAYVNMPKVRAKLQPHLAEGRTKIMAEVDQGLANDPNAAKYAPVIKALVGELLDVADTLLKDTQGLTYGVGFEDQGIKTTTVAEFNPSSNLGSSVAKMKNTDQPLLAGLPAGKYLMFGGGISSPEMSQKLISSLIDPLVSEFGKMGPEQAQAGQKFVDAIKKYAAAVKSQSGGWVAPSGALGQDPILQTIIVQHGDPATLKQSYMDVLNAQHDLQQSLMKNMPGAQDQKMTVTPNAKTVEGVTFDSVNQQMNFQNAGPGAAQAQMMMNYLFGPNGPTSMIGQVGDKVLVTSGVTDQTLTSAIASTKADTDNLSKVAGVQSVSAQLPKSRMGVFFLPLDQLVNTIATYAAAMGMNVQVQLPPDLPPIGGTVASEGSAVRVDSYTPTELIKAVTAAGMQVYMQMMGGRQPGGPGGL